METHYSLYSRLRPARTLSTLTICLVAPCSHMDTPIPYRSSTALEQTTVHACAHPLRLSPLPSYSTRTVPLNGGECGDSRVQPHQAALIIDLRIFERSRSVSATAARRSRRSRSCRSRSKLNKLPMLSRLKLNMVSAPACSTTSDASSFQRPRARAAAVPLPAAWCEAEGERSCAV